ncbi:type IX secretion system membrane protein PorP/SprF [Persicobacter psychrovividus]|uniref:Type IX secretion system membrane protein PorP/SprF n=1 Tax=Persicobacter psychrovividus TaxID=387638 RepID=A0ABN6L863_9BACT|nr:hypothetical protein PEPS_16680 [Persicobacter psychrovividus]
MPINFNSMLLLKPLRYLFLFGLLICGAFSAHAQDPQFSQFYAAPLYLNPGFTGNTQMTRFGLNYRNQWPSLPGSFVTYSAYVDHYIDDYNSGIGLLAVGDQIGLGSVSSNMIAMTYAYQLPISRNLSFRPGVQLSYTSQNANYSNLVFGSQIDPGTGEILPPGQGIDPSLTGVNNGFMDLGLGGVLYSKSAWLGVSAYHLLQPNLSAIDNSDDKLPMKFSAHGGYRFVISKKAGRGYSARDYAITPTFQYKLQGKFDQLDLGLYAHLSPIVLGLWYRGIPVRTTGDHNNSDSMVGLVGFEWNGFNFGYSYDYTISGLSSRSGGAHEVSVTYVVFLGDKRKPAKHIRQIPCPAF